MPTLTTGPKRPRLILLLIPLSLVAFVWTAVRIVDSLQYVDSDFFTFWLSGHLVTLGQNPYVSSIWLAAHHQFGATWITNATFIYPLPVAFLFAPFGLLPLHDAYVVWIVLSECMIVCSLALLLTRYPSRLAWAYALPLLVGVAPFYPTILAIKNGQFSPFLLLVLAGIVYLWERERWAAGSLLLPLVALKPNLGVPIILLLSVYLLLRGQLRALLVGAASGLVLLLIGFLQNPGWIMQFWAAGNTKLSQIFGFAPTVWGVSAFFCSHDYSCSVALGAAFGLPLLALCLVLIARGHASLAPIWAVGLALTTTLLVTPTTWPYDQLLLLIPIVAITMHMALRGIPFLAAALVFPALTLLGFIEVAIAAAVKLGIWTITLPLCVLMLLAWALHARQPVPVVAAAG